MIAKIVLSAWFIMLAGISAASADNDSVPLGDGKIATVPHAGVLGVVMTIRTHASRTSHRCNSAVI